MNEGTVVCIITVALITALFLAWFFYQQAKNRERMVLIERGENLEDIFQIQKRNKFTFLFPWLKLGIVFSIMSIAFLIIGFIFRSEGDLEVFKGFLITFIIGIFLGVSMLINHRLRDQ